MIKSIRWRLQLWYTAVLLAILVGFGGVMYQQSRAAAFQRVDLQLTGAVRYLDAALHAFPPHFIDGQGGGIPPNDHPPPRDPHPREWDDRGPERRRRPPPAPPPRGPPPAGAPDREDGRNPGPPEDRPEGRANDPLDDQDAEPNRRADRAPPGRADRQSGRAPGRPVRDAGRDDERDPERGPPPRGVRHPPLGPHPPRTLAEHLQTLDLRRPFSPDPGAESDEDLYFSVWKHDGSLLKIQGRGRTPQSEEAPLKPPAATGGLRFLRRDMYCEAIDAGPHGTVIVVGKSIGRELAELRRFAWTLLASGGVALVVGVSGGWLISARVLRPIAAISQTASAISVSELSRRIDIEAVDQELLGLAKILNAMFARLEDAFERQRRFTADASHELRTPLAILYTNLELAVSRPRSVEEYQETLHSGLKAAARMRTLVDGLLILARSDAGRLDVTRQRVDLTSVATEAVAHHAPLAAERQVNLSSPLASPPVYVAGDATFLSRIASNLIANAIRYTPSDGHVDISVGVDGDFALLTVSDTGCGIPLECQGRIFERFYRVDPARARAQGGNGLGLAICKSLVEAHHGTISFTSAPGAGCTFVVAIPLASEAHDEPPPRTRLRLRAS